MLDKKRNQSGVTMIETLIIFPIVMMIGLWIVHLGLLYQARANLEYAALMGARIGAVTSVDIVQMQNEIAARMVASQMGNKALVPANIVISVLNPTRQMFLSCGVIPLDPAVNCGFGVNRCELPNFGLPFRDPNIKNCAGSNIQDANILRIRVSYNFVSGIPFMDMRLFAADKGMTNMEQGTTVSAVATVRMQTPARYLVTNAGSYVDL